MMDMHFVDRNGNHFVVPNAPAGYARDDATKISAPPSDEHRWILGAWRVPDPKPPQVPFSVTRAQGKAALIQAGLWGSVLDYVDSIDDPTERALADVALNDTTEWLRTSPFLAAAADAIGLTPAQLDDLFRDAAAIAL